MPHPRARSPAIPPALPGGCSRGGTSSSAASRGLGAAALASLLAGESGAASLPGLPHFAPKAKRIIYLFQHGAPSQLDLFDHKPALAKLRGQDLPASVRMGQRLTGMTAFQATFPTAPSIFRFARHGQSGSELSEMLPYTAKVADEIAIIRSLHTEAINHDPAVTFFQTGFQLAGRPSFGSWIAYGLGSENRTCRPSSSWCRRVRARRRRWPTAPGAAGFCPPATRASSSARAPIRCCILSNPAGYEPPARRRFLDDLAELNQMKHRDGRSGSGDRDRIAQYEMAFRMQTRCRS
jgi:hypothetical protein